MDSVEKQMPFSGLKLKLFCHNKLRAKNDVGKISRCIKEIAILSGA